MSDLNDTTLDSCGCCEPQPDEPVTYNRPGLPALAYRLGAYATFFRRMIGRLATDTLPSGDHAGQRPLADLTTRSGDDPSIALLDASAVVADVLTFYQERIVNEGFLRTATERRSVLELARSIGYELNPGVAASTFLAFTVEDAPGSPPSAIVFGGTKVQSIPPQDKLPQTFETTEDITAQVEWNAMHPRMGQPQSIESGIKQVYLKGTSTGLKAGDLMVIISGTKGTPKRVLSVDVQSDLNRTRVIFDASAGAGTFTTPVLAAGNPAVTNVVQKDTTMNTYIVQKQWSDKDLNTFLSVNEWNISNLRDYLTRRRSTHPTSTSGKVYALRTRLGFFGNNAPLWKTLPVTTSTRGDPYPGDWDANPRTIWTTSQNKDYGPGRAYLERTVPEIVIDSYVVLEDRNTQKTYQVKGVFERSRADFGLSSKTTSLTLRTLAGSIDEDSTFKVRRTTAYVQSELLDAVEIPIEDKLDAGDTELMLDQFALGLRVGQAVVLSGERHDAPGVTQTEVLIVKEIDHVGGFTVLTFEDGLQFPYKRTTVSINANVARATHGETVTETLGSGDTAQKNQRFVLKKPPLTYVSAPTAGGGESTLQVRVNDVQWSEAPSLYGLADKDQKYIVRIDDDAKASVTFGDGVRGARLPTGANNLTATYRSGIGLDGEVDANTLTMLQTRPLGIRGVTNPLAASGAADPAKLAQARTNAPLTVLTLDRIVSLIDYENFTRAFNGIGKAQAAALWNDERYLIHITIAGANGKAVDVNSDLFKNLVDAIDAARDPAQQVRVDNFMLRQFNVKASVVIDERYDDTIVLPQVESALLTAFSFEQRSFGQPVTAAEVITVIQGVPGIIATDLDELYRAGFTQKLNQVLSAPVAHWLGNTIKASCLLLINPVGIKVTEQ